MEWDDAGLNITVNPLEDIEKTGRPVTAPEYSDYESSEAGERYPLPLPPHTHKQNVVFSSYRDEDELTEDDDDAEEVLPHVPPNRQGGNTGLEWDDSTLANNNHSRSYRV
jgi:hypothetical protein